MKQALGSNSYPWGHNCIGALYYSCDMCEERFSQNTISKCNWFKDEKDGKKCCYVVGKGCCIE